MPIKKIYLSFLCLVFSLMLLSVTASAVCAHNLSEKEQLLPTVNLEESTNEYVPEGSYYKEIKNIPNGLSRDQRQYIIELLKKHKIAQAVNTANQINKTGIFWQGEHSVISLYMARYGECKKATDIVSAILKSKEKYEHKGQDIDFTVKNMAVANALCGKLANAANLIKTYNEEAEIIGTTYKSKKAFYKKIAWKSDIYSAVGAYLYLANHKDDSAIYFDYSISLNEKSSGFKKSEGYDNIIYNYILSGQVREAYELAKKSSNNREIYQSILMAAAYNEDMPLIKEMMLSPRIEKYVQNAYANAIVLLISRKEKNPYFDLKPFLTDLFKDLRGRQRKDNRHVIASIYIAKIFGKRGHKTDANDIMKAAEAWLKQTYSSSNMPPEYADEIAKTYVIIDKSPYRAYEAMTSWSYPANKEAKAWGYIVGAAKLTNDQNFLDRVVRGLKRDYPSLRKYNDRNKVYLGAEAEFFAEIGEYEKSAHAIDKIQGLSSKEILYRSIHAIAKNESREEMAFKDFQITGDKSNLKLGVNPYYIKIRKQKMMSMMGSMQRYLKRY